MPTPNIMIERVKVTTAAWSGMAPPGAPGCVAKTCTTLRSYCKGERGEGMCSPSLRWSGIVGEYSMQITGCLLRQALKTSTVIMNLTEYETGLCGALFDLHRLNQPFISDRNKFVMMYSLLNMLLLTIIC